MACAGTAQLRKRIGELLLARGAGAFVVMQRRETLVPRAAALGYVPGGRLGEPARKAREMHDVIREQRAHTDRGERPAPRGSRDEPSTAPATAMAASAARVRR